jgi:hypothetical protein
VPQLEQVGLDLPRVEKKSGVFLLLCEQAKPQSAVRARTASTWRSLERYRRTIVVANPVQLKRELGRNRCGIGVIVEGESLNRSPWCTLFSARADAPGGLCVGVHAVNEDLRALDGVALIHLPATSLEFRDFAARALVREVLSRPLIASAVLALVKQFDLSPREGELLAVAVAGVPREALFEETGTSPNTVKRQIRSLLCKCGAASMDRVIIRVLHDALRTGTAPPTLPRSDAGERLLSWEEEVPSSFR